MLLDKIKNLLNQKQEGNNKKQIENLVAFVIILIITIIAINTIWNKDDPKEDTNSTQEINKKLAIEQEKNDDLSLSDNLENILSKIDGVGRVKAFITYSQTSQIIPVYNENISQKDTSEEDKQGGNRKITETDTKKEVIYEENAGQKKIITRSIVSPQIEGAIITAEGGGNNKVKADIITAVEAVTGLSTHKIQVYQMKGEG